jgi:hypothetical protein
MLTRCEDLGDTIAPDTSTNDAFDISLASTTGHVNTIRAVGDNHPGLFFTLAIHINKYVFLYASSPVL